MMILVLWLYKKDNGVMNWAICQDINAIVVPAKYLFVFFALWNLQWDQGHHVINRNSQVSY